MAATLDLKKAAKAVGEKSIAMLHSKGSAPHRVRPRGLLPIGMKKQFPTVFHQSALEQETIFVSAGKDRLKPGGAVPRGSDEAGAGEPRRT